MSTENEQAVFVYLPARGDVLAQAALWEDRLMALLEGLGEVDGSEVGNDWVKLFIYGSNAAELVQAIKASALSAAPEGAYLVARYGSPGAHEERFSLAPRRPES